MRIASGVEKLPRRDAIYVNAGAVDKLPRCDAIYVNAGATRPEASWLDALNEGGKLLFPLVGLKGAGVTLLTTKLKGSIAVKVIGYCGFIPCQDVFEPVEAANVAAAFNSRELWKARSLIRNDDPDDNAILIGKGWWLSK